MARAGWPKARVVEFEAMEGEGGNYVIQDFADLEMTLALTLHEVKSHFIAENWAEGSQFCLVFS